MSKKFEGANLSPVDIVDGYVKMGLGHLLGTPGLHTVIERDRNLTSETVEIFCLPGKLNSADFMSLLRDAGLMERPKAQAA